MARSNRQSRRRDINNYPIASGTLPFGLVSPLSSSIFSSRPAMSLLSEFEDRREWHPEGFARPARLFSRPRHRLSLVDQPRRSRTPLNRDPFSHLRSFNSQTKARIAFREPDRVLVCVRRNIRKEVLHAFRKTGRVGQRRPRRSFYSSISCRR